MAAMNHTEMLMSLIKEYKALDSLSEIEINGHSLTIATAAAISSKHFRRVVMSPEVAEELRTNAKFLLDLLATGHAVYGVNTGYGGSANVRSAEAVELQQSFIRHLNVGFADRLDPEVMRVVMAVRANSLARGYSGVGPEVVDMLCAMLSADVVPLAPLRGSISASGDLVPTSYLAACMSGRKDVLCLVDDGTRQMSAPDALAHAGLEPIEFGPKEALAIANAASVAASLAAITLFDAGLAVLLTELITGMAAEAMTGRLESFDKTVHDVCLPHQGNIEVAQNMRSILRESRWVQTVHDWRIDDKLVVDTDCADGSGEGDGRARLKQDRYPLRTAAQWLGPATETWMESVRRVSVELNSANDNPLIDHRTQEILHCGNFQGLATTVAMDQVRQSIQLCGRLVFAQLTELFNHHMGHGLPPNLSGANVCVDFGFKGVDLCTASLTSELEHITGPLTNHVMSAEMHNQSVNSMALVSARTTSKALQLLQMILTNALSALSQALDLRWLEVIVRSKIANLVDRSGIKLPTFTPPGGTVTAGGDLWGFIPWYDVAFCPQRVSGLILDARLEPKNHVIRDEFVEQVVTEMQQLMADLSNGKFIDDVAAAAGKGTRKSYLFVRRTLGVPFHDGVTTLDHSLEKIYNAIRNRDMMDTIADVFSSGN